MPTLRIMTVLWDIYKSLSFKITLSILLIAPYLVAICSYAILILRRCESKVSWERLREMEQSIDRSRDKQSLFRTGHSYGNIILNFQNAASSEFDVYARAFHTAGQALFERMFDKSGYNSLEGCPIIFLYRHALELYLKAIVLHGEAILRVNGKTLLTNRGLLQKHSLLPFLPLLKQTFAAVGWTWKLDIEGLHTFEEVEALLRDFETVDLGSYTFRYPVDTKGNPSVPPHFVVHMPTFCKRMDALLEALEAALMGLEVTEERMLEAAYVAQERTEKERSEDQD